MEKLDIAKIEKARQERDEINKLMGFNEQSRKLDIAKIEKARQERDEINKLMGF